MKKLFSHPFYVLPIVLALAACGGNKDEAKPDAKASVQIPQLAAADILRTSIAPVAETLPFTATLNARTSTDVAAEVEGQVREVLVREGEVVRRGQRLAVLDGETLQQLLDEQQSQLANDESRLKLARQKMEKQRELFRQGFISRMALDEVESEFRIREGDVKSRRSQLQRAQKNLKDTVVVSPMDGVVYARQIQPGEQVGRNQKLFSIADLSSLEAVASIPARDIAQLKTGMTANFRLEGSADTHSAKLTRINPVASESTRTFQIYLQVDNANAALKAGQFIQGELILRQQEGAISLPLAAVRDADSKPWVMLLKGGTLQKQPVTILLRNEQARRVAVSGIAPGQDILSAPLLGLKAGDRVQLPGKGS